jgi:hypothetical protein|tara:strand:+ start:119 stop:283 length:165 start_codon:yes stop_codon:yes gene_type:complete
VIFSEDCHRLLVVANVGQWQGLFAIAELCSDRRMVEDVAWAVMASVMSWGLPGI